MSATVPAGPQTAASGSRVAAGSGSLIVRWNCVPGRSPEGPISAVVSCG